MRPIDADALWKTITEYAKSKGDCPLHIAEIYRCINETLTISTPIINDMEIRNEDDEDRKKKLWLFNHGLY